MKYKYKTEAFYWLVHETATGYAQCFAKDAYNDKMGVIRRESIHFSEQVLLETDSRFFKK